MASFFQNIVDLNLWYIPIIAITLILMIGSVIGYLNGAKPAFYFFGFNLLALLIGVFAGGKIYDDNIDSWLGKNKIGEIISENKEVLRGLVLLICIFALVIVINLIALFIYIFIRKYLKKHMKLLAKNGHSIVGSRIIGAGIGFMSAVPMAMVLGGTTQIVSSNKTFSKMTSKFVQISTFGKVENLYDDVDTIKILGATADTIKDIADIFLQDSSTNEPSENWSQNIKNLKNLLNSDQAQTIATNLVSKFTDSDDKNSNAAKLTTVPAEIENIKTMIKNVLGNPKDNGNISLSSKERTNFINLVRNAFDNKADKITIKNIIDGIVITN